MPINPIDLQTNFAQIGQVGKILSAIKDSEELKEYEQNAIIKKASENETEDIPVTKDVDEGPGKIRDQKKKNQNQENEKKKDNESDSDEKQDNDELIMKDYKNPSIGQKIDIVG